MQRHFTKGIVVGAILAGLLLAGTAGAQIVGLYYQEVTKDGRIYVFNTSERYQAFQKTGEMGTSITLIGRGPNGETVVAENETAIDLFLFKHNLPAYDRATTKPPKPDFAVSWKDGKTTIESKSAQLQISNRMQVRFTEEDPEEGEGRGSFRIRRMRTKFEGWVYTKDLTYELQVDWTEAPAMRDAYFNFDMTKGKKAFQIKAGQFKVPFGRQELTSSGSQQFVDRAIASEEFAKGRDIGLQLHGLLVGGALDWRIGAFNGGGRNQARNDNDAYQYNARLTWQPFGDVKYSESDFDSSDKPLFALAAGYESNDKHGATTGNDNDRSIVGGDVVFKYKGLFAYGEYYDANNQPETGADYGSEGSIAQVGYFVIPKTLEVALRHSQIDPSDLVENDKRIETGVVLGYFFNKHNHKLQADYRQIEDEKKGTKDNELRVQYQIIF
jgi:phosphate-selective porin OprO and OprP